jgi:hypothetical protein
LGEVCRPGSGTGPERLQCPLAVVEAARLGQGGGVTTILVRVGEENGGKRGGREGGGEAGVDVVGPRRSSVTGLVPHYSHSCTTKLIFANSLCMVDCLFRN